MTTPGYYDTETGLLNDGATMTIADVQNGITNFTQDGGALGANLSVDKPVLMQVGDKYYPLRYVKAAFVRGSFVLLLSDVAEEAAG